MRGLFFALRNARRGIAEVADLLGEECHFTLQLEHILLLGGERVVQALYVLALKSQFCLEIGNPLLCRVTRHAVPRFAKRCTLHRESAPEQS